MNSSEDRRPRTEDRRRKSRFLCFFGFRPSDFGLRIGFRYAFTMIEIMLVVIIIGSLAAMVMPRLTGRSEQARVAGAKVDVTANIPTALKLYELDNGVFPTSTEGIGALLEKPAGAEHWKGPYLDRKAIDPWGREYKYVSPGVHRPNDYDLYSLGKDGAEGNDDVTNWD